MGAQAKFTVNGNNAAKKTRATVPVLGTYTFEAAIHDSAYAGAVSTVKITLSPVVTSITVSPASAFIANDATQAFTAVAKDQFGAIMNPAPPFSWTVNGGGTISPDAVFSSDSVTTGTFTVTATSGGLSQVAQVTTIENLPPVITDAPAASPPIVTLPGVAVLDVGAFDPDALPLPSLLYTWSKVSGPGTVVFSPNGTTSSTVVASFSQWGTYELNVDIFDGVSITSDITTVVVEPDPTQPITMTFQEGVNGYTGEVDLTITTQSQAPYNGYNGNVYNGPSLFVQDTSASANGFAAETLIRFGNLALPAGSKVLSANLTLSFSTYASGYAVTGYYLNTTWNPAAPQYQIGWVNRDTALLWSTPGALGDGTDIVSGRLFSFYSFVPGQNQLKTVPLDASIVGGWLLNPSSNQGVILTSAPGKSGTVSSASDPVALRRPLLTVTYEAAVVEPATASPAVVTGTSTALHVLGRDFPAEGGEPSLTYTWSSTSEPPGAQVTFSQNGTNAAKDTIATFSQAGAYTLTATIVDANGIPATSSVDVLVVDNAAPVLNAAEAQPSVFALPNSTTLTADATDPDSYPGGALSYTWSLVSGPGPVMFSSNNSPASSAVQASFTVAGAYTLSVTVSDGVSSTSSFVVVNVGPDPSTPITATFQQGVSGYTGEVDLTITTQEIAAYNGFNGNVYRGAQIYCQDTSSAPSGFIGKGLFRFGQLGIPSNAIVTDATLTVTFTTYSIGFSATGRYLNGMWDPAAPVNKIGWANRDATHLWAAPGATGEGTDLISGISFGVSTSTTGPNQVRTVTLDPGVVQGWVADAESNQGLSLMCPAGVVAQISSGTDRTWGSGHGSPSPTIFDSFCLLPHSP